jgi:tRNA A37 threonylcarbamoyladenosine dehydratase
LLTAPPGTDLIVDAIDTMASKIDLILQAKKRGIPVISSMGAGNRLDPSAFRVADIYRTEGCPLAKRVRKELRAAGVVSHVVVYSTELPVRKGPPGSMMCVTGAAGLVLAGEAIRRLLATPEGS